MRPPGLRGSGRASRRRGGYLRPLGRAAILLTWLCMRPGVGRPLGPGGPTTPGELPRAFAGRPPGTPAAPLRGSPGTAPAGLARPEGRTHRRQESKRGGVTVRGSGAGEGWVRLLRPEPRSAAAAAAASFIFAAAAATCQRERRKRRRQRRQASLAGLGRNSRASPIPRPAHPAQRGRREELGEEHPD